MSITVPRIALAPQPEGDLRLRPLGIAILASCTVSVTGVVAVVSWLLGA